ncbi:MAG: hypothetical protein U0N20_01895 [Clostridium sp.]
MIDEEKLIEEITNLYNEYANNQTRFKRQEIKAIYRFIGALTYRIENMPKVNNWIPVEVAMPPEHDSMFAKLKGTDKWADAMFEKISDDVNVTIEFEDGKRITRTMHTIDGEWKGNYFQKFKVVAWMPLPEKYEGGVIEWYCT